MEAVKRFLLEMGVSPELTDLDETTDKLLNEMEKGLNREESSLQMIPSYIGETFRPVPGERVAAVDAGGTNLRVSLIRFNDDLTPTIEKIERFPMPGSREPVDSDTFFDELAEHLSEILKVTKKIGFCFSYAVEIQPSRDGRIITLSKEVVVKNCEGKMIGEELQKALRKRGASEFTHISVLNDTTASLLGGRLFCHNRDYSSYIGFILGTGTNTAYYEKNSRIAKDPALSHKDGSTIINLESGNFDKMVSGKLDDEFRSETLVPTEYQMEKMMSGHYLGELLLKYMQKGAEHGLFSDGAKASILALTRLQGRDMDDFLAHPNGNTPIASLPGLTEADRAVIYELIDAMLERTARLVVSCYMACAKRTDMGSDPLHPILITAEGTTYYRCELLKQKIDYYIEHALRRERGIYVQTMQVENAVIYGTALAAVCE